MQSYDLPTILNGIAHQLRRLRLPVEEKDATDMIRSAIVTLEDVAKQHKEVKPDDPENK